MSWSLFPKMKDFPRNQLDSEMTQDAIEFVQVWSYQDCGLCYQTIIDLCLAGF
jgi:hypothetical protein